MGTAVANYDEAYAKLAQQQADEEQSGGMFITTKGGVLSFQDEQMPGNQMCVVILDAVRENTFYTGKYDPEVQTPPKCYAFARGNEEMGPHESMAKHLDYFEPQAEDCSVCPHNEYGSADTGRGKACQNRRRLALIPAGFYSKVAKSKDYHLELFDDPKHYQTADIAFLKIPTTSVKEWSKYVTQLSAQFHRPSFGVITRIYLENDAKTQFKVRFEMVEELSHDLAPAIFARNEEAKKNIITPYAPPAPQETTKTGKLKLKGRT